MELLKRLRKVYYFGYGAERDPAMIAAITGHTPRVVGQAVLKDYELRIQSIHEVTTAGGNPRQILERAWGASYQSYVIVPRHGAQLKGTLFKLSLHDRHLIDRWELVEEGWYQKTFVDIRLASSNKLYHAETQMLGAQQRASQIADGLRYSMWLQPKHTFIRLAAQLREQA